MCVFVMLMISSLCLGVWSGNCPELYKRFSKDHTFCLPRNPQCTILKKGVDSNDIAIILREHNKLRSKVATGGETTYSLPQASNMNQLEWDEELAAVAQKHAEQCIFDHDCNECRQVKNFGVGQNLYTSGENPKPQWAEFVNGWYSEVKDFDQGQLPRFIDGKGPPQTGHFTQVVWGTTFKVGCGYASYKKGNAREELYTCNYGPGGNIEGAEVYKEGEPCSNCPLNSCCGESCTGQSYPGLCKIPPNTAPQYPRPENLFFYCSFSDEPDCATTTSGAKKWKVQDTLSGRYMSIVLNGGETSTLIFERPLKFPEGTMCFIINYRSGPQVAGQATAGKGFVKFELPDDPSFKYNPALQSKGDMSFTKFSIGLGWGDETRVSVNFSVPPGKPSQFLEVQDVQARQGPC